MILRLLTKHHLEFPSLTEGCTGSSEHTILLETTCCGSSINIQITDNALINATTQNVIIIQYLKILKYTYGIKKRNKDFKSL